MVKHGLRDTPIYRIWAGIKSRCLNPNNSRWASYGGRGITICEDWRNDVVAFATYVGPRPSAEHTIDRIDNDRGYEPGNVRWATRSEQQRNTRRRASVAVIDGEVLTTRQIIERTGLKRSTVQYRMRSGYTPEQIVSPLHCGVSADGKRVKTSQSLEIVVNGRSYTPSELSAASGLGVGTIRYRYHAGYRGSDILQPRQKQKKATS